MKEHIPGMMELIEEPTVPDCKYIVKHFLGLTRAEAQKMIEDEDPHPCSVYTEDLMWMAPKGVAYYLTSFIEAYKMSFNRGAMNTPLILEAEYFVHCHVKLFIISRL